MTTHGNGSHIIKVKSSRNSDGLRQSIKLQTVKLLVFYYVTIK